MEEEEEEEEEEEFADETSHQPKPLTEEVVHRLVGQATVPSMDEVRTELDRVPRYLFDNLSEEARRLLGQEIAAEALRSAGHHPVRGPDIESAARRIGARIRAGTGEFSRLSQVDRTAILDGCPWC